MVPTFQTVPTAWPKPSPPQWDERAVAIWIQHSRLGRSNSGVRYPDRSVQLRQ